jgi:beta-lactamase class A
MGGTGGTGIRLLLRGAALLTAGLCLAGSAGGAGPAALAAGLTGGQDGRGAGNGAAGGGATGADGAMHGGGAAADSAATGDSAAGGSATGDGATGDNAAGTWRGGLVKTPAAVLAAAAEGPVREGSCIAPGDRRMLAARLSADIALALANRYGDSSAAVYDRATGVDCTVNGGRQFDSASVVKMIILAALLRWHQETGAPLSDDEKYLATLMITQSDNDAATALWNEVGLQQMQHFLDLAKMRETVLNTWGAWGLTLVTAHDEMLLLRLLTGSNAVLTTASRDYQLGLMAQVITGQRWGTPAGAPASVTVQVKNGWLPLPDGWHVNSLGAFTGNGRDYMIVVLTDGDPSEQYGIDTIEGLARLVHRDLNAVPPPSAARLAATVGPAPSPFAIVPALPTPPPTPPPAASQPAATPPPVPQASPTAGPGQR